MKPTKRTRRCSANRPIKVRHARCKRVLVILNNRVEIVDLLREETHFASPHTELDYEPVDLAVVLFAGVQVYVSCACVVFLHDKNEPRRQRNPASALRSRWSPKGFVIEGTLPDGKYVAMEVSGKRVAVTAYSRSADLKRAGPVSA